MHRFVSRRFVGYQPGTSIFLHIFQDKRACPRVSKKTKSSFSFGDVPYSEYPPFWPISYALTKVHSNALCTLTN